MKQILPGLFHWSAVHERIGIRVHSCYLERAGVLVDPMTPREGVAWFGKRRPPESILLTNRHHYRHSARFVKAYGCTVWCHRAGLHEFTKEEEVRPFEHGDRLVGGILALEVASLCPEETALFIARHQLGSSGSGGGKGAGRGAKAGRAGTKGGRAGAAGGVLALGDAIIRGSRGGLQFVPDEYMGEDPEGVKHGLLAAFRRLLRREFDTLLLAHGAPLVGRGKDALREFVEARSD